METITTVAALITGTYTITALINLDKTRGRSKNGTILMVALGTLLTTIFVIMTLTGK